jgi:hypothetical protein
MDVNINADYDGVVKKKTVVVEGDVTKEYLTQTIKEMFGLSHFKLERRSKRSKKYVQLETPEDYAVLKRSLKVKKTITLRVIKVSKAKKSGKDHDKGHRDERKTDDSVSVPKEQFEKLCRDIKDLAVSLKTNIGSKESESFQSKKTVGYHHKVHCDACCLPGDPEYAITGTRYECLVCHNYDLCEKCFSQGVSTLFHSKDHIMKRVEPIDQICLDVPILKTASSDHAKKITTTIRHHGTIFCDVCSPRGAPLTTLTGVRYKCLDCYDYDLCGKCFNEHKTSGSHVSTHRMKRLEPTQRLVVDQFVEGPEDFIDTSEWDPLYKENIESLVEDFDTLEKLDDLKVAESEYKKLLSLANGEDVFELVKAGLQKIKVPAPIHPTIRVDISKVANNLQIKVTNLSRNPTRLNSMLEFVSLEEDPFKVKFCLLKSIPSGGFMKFNTDVSRFVHGGQFNEKSCFCVRMLDPDGEEYLQGECKDGSATVTMSPLIEKPIPQGAFSTPAESTVLHREDESTDDDDQATLNPEADASNFEEEEAEEEEVQEQERGILTSDETEEYETDALDDYEILSADDWTEQ